MKQKIIIDQTGRTVNLSSDPPRRIISLVPSQTELLADLALEQEVVGLTKFCVHPDHWRHEKTVIGGTKQLHLNRIRTLQPDLIIANQEENDREQVLALAREFPVWVSRVKDLPTALEMITALGILTHRTTRAGELVTAIEQAFAGLERFAPRRVAYLIWRKPYMVSGGDTFIQAMLTAAGFINVFAERDRYPEVSSEVLVAADPELVLLSSEPYPFGEKHRAELSAICPKAAIRLVDGEMFSWYGSRLLKAAAYFRNLRLSLEQLG